jgi:hypothetical protein
LPTWGVEECLEGSVVGSLVVSALTLTPKLVSGQHYKDGLPWRGLVRGLVRGRGAWCVVRGRGVVRAARFRI